MNTFFNAHHSPIGAFASFTLGFPGAAGGLGLELHRPADQSVYVGLEDRSGRWLEALPFFAGAEKGRACCAAEQAKRKSARPALVPFERSRIARTFRVATDAWTAGDLAFRILSPVRAIPDPLSARDEELKSVLLPAVCVELTVDNRRGIRARRAFFGYQGSDPYSAMRRLDDTSGGRFAGIGQGRCTAIVSRDPGVASCQGAILAPKIEEDAADGLGALGALTMTVPPGRKKTFRFAVCFYRGGIATSGMDASYFYTRFFDRIEDVASYALEHFGLYAGWAVAADAQIEEARLSADQKFLLAHSIRSYYGNTELLDLRGKPFWVVNEGEYRMMNTFDLAADHLFYEMWRNPWTVRNTLDMFADRYSYRDTLHFPDHKRTYSGGVSFTHDMGVANVLSRPGHSAYERCCPKDDHGQMTHEELVNWVLCASVYAEQAADRAWLDKRLPLFKACLQSLMNRDHPDPKRRDGVMKVDSSRAVMGGEITTYDSLDASLRQARNNLYLAVKTWAAYLALAGAFRKKRCAALAKQAEIQAQRCAATIRKHATPEGYIPAVIREKNDSRIIPAVEGLVFPSLTGRMDALNPNGPYGDFIRALKRHLETALAPGVCLFPDGGWKLSSTSDNSFLSKIYLCQFVAKKILGINQGRQERKADAAHVRWLTHPALSYWSCSDQIIAGKITASRYYPRGVTCILWLSESRPSQAGPKASGTCT